MTKHIHHIIPKHMGGSDENYVKKMTNSNRNNNRKVVSLSDGKITSWSNRTKHEKKTGFKHEWKDLGV